MIITVTRMERNNRFSIDFHKKLMRCLTELIVTKYMKVNNFIATAT